MASSTLHIVFDPSAADRLRDALKQSGRDDRVIALSDDLSFGPINPYDEDTRARWVREEFASTEWDEIGSEARAFWATALLGDADRTVWLSRRSTREYAAFLEFVWRLGEAPCRLVDITDLTLVRDWDGAQRPPRLVAGLDCVPGSQIVELGLLDRARDFATEQREAYRGVWQKLREENAPLRVVLAALEMISAPLSYFDQDLLSCAKHKWVKSARIVGDTMELYRSDARGQMSSMVLIPRFQALVDAGLLEGQGDLSRIRFSEVRLPAAPAAPVPGELVAPR
ncbi:MAG TPA: DUF3658 domain-containing protein [Stellaceae bacterium]|nr:DUF3658 domain-containing protein [Stellaceae bacterium]